MDLHTHPHVKSSSDDGVNKVAEPAATYPGKVPLMRPIRLELFVLERLCRDNFDRQVLILWYIHHFYVIAVDSYIESEINARFLPFLCPSAISLSHQIEVWSYGGR